MPESTAEVSPPVKAQKKPPAETSDTEVRYHTLVARIQPADHRADGAGFATHLHCVVDSVRDGKVIHTSDAQEKIHDRVEAIPMPLKVHPEADQIEVTITSIREDDDMETLELARHQTVKIEDLRRGPMKMPVFHQSLAVTIPPPTTMLVDDLCGPDGESLIAERDRPVSSKPERPIYRIDDPVSTMRGVGTISDFKEGTTVQGSGFVHGSHSDESQDAPEHGPPGPIVVVKVADDLVDFYADDVKPYHMTGQG